METVALKADSRILEVGAGDGAYTEPILAAGYAVTATEVSMASVTRLNARFGLNEQFTSVYDPDGTLDAIKDGKFAAILCVSVLHHIPDYLSFVEEAMQRHLLEGGSFLCLQDPLWYPDLAGRNRQLSRIAYASWRTTKGNYWQGFETLTRRIRGVYDDSKSGDMVEYHVVRQGVNEAALERLLAPLFERVQIVRYWSTQAAIWQRLGESLGLENTFAINAQGFTGK